MIQKILLTLLTLVCAATSAVAQENLYVLKGNKVIASYPVADIDSVTFKLTGSIDANLYNITAEADRMCEISTVTQAVPGQTVIVNVTSVNERYRVASLTANSEDCTYITDDGTTWRYKFTMPESDVILVAESEIDYHNITPYASNHAYLTMLNCCDNWDAPEDERVFTEAVNGLVKFYYGADTGYDVSIRAYSESGEELEIQYTDEDMDFAKCYFVAMPDEDITIEVKAKERITYRGMDFVGEYTGYELFVGTNNLYSATTPTFEAELLGNTAYTATDSRETLFTAAGMYDYSTTNNIFTYVEPSTDQGVTTSKGFGLNGRWLEDNGNALFWFSNIDEDKPDNVRLFFASQYAFGFACAAVDTYGTRYLAQLSRINGNTYYYIDSRTREVTPVSLTFESGTSIADVSKARAYSTTDGTKPLFSYELTSAQATPVFVFAGNEAGIYTLQGGNSSSAKLELDGLGTATYGGQTGTYTVSNNIINVTIGGTTLTFSINTETSTYLAITSNEWDGPLNFTATTSEACYDEALGTTGTIHIGINQNVAGKTTEGKAKVQAFINDNYKKERETNASTVAYAYDAANSTLTLSGILVGTENGRSTERIDIELKVSADKQTLTCEKNIYLRAASGGDSRYIPMKGLVFSAAE